MERQTAAEAFAHRLRGLMDSRGYSVRGLGKTVDPGDPERGRRRLQRHLSGSHLPSQASRDGYAEALEVDASELPLPDDEENQDIAATFSAISREHRAVGHRIEMLGRALAVRS